MQKILIFLAGAGLGAGATYLMLNQKYDRLYREACPPPPVRTATVETEETKEYHAIDSSPLPPPVDIPRTEYATSMKASIDIIEENGYAKRDEVTENTRKAFIITEEEYSTTKLSFDKYVITVYDADGGAMMIDENGEAINAGIRDRIGYDAPIECLRTKSDVYVRNMAFAADYMLEYKEGWYGES